MDQSEAKKDTSEEKPKKKRYRRCSKEDKTPRDFLCGCGRGYYSYPALYTHIKSKNHEFYGLDWNTKERPRKAQSTLRRNKKANNVVGNASEEVAYTHYLIINIIDGFDRENGLKKGDSDAIYESSNDEWYSLNF